MSNSFADQVHYARSENGTDVYVLKTPTKDVVTCMLAFPDMGTYASYASPSVVKVLADLLPSGTPTYKKKTVLEKFESLGAKVSVSYSGKYLLVTLASRNVFFLDAFQLLLEVLSKPVVTPLEYKASWSRIKNTYTHIQEDTRTQARIALRQAMYRKGHPHWLPSTKQCLQELEGVTVDTVLAFHQRSLTSIGSIVTVVGDVQPKKIMQSLQTLVHIVPTHVPSELPKLHIEHTNNPLHSEHIVTIKNKLNVDTFVGIPLSITRSDTDFQTLQVGVHVLGASSNARLFNVLRTKKNLTYGSYATLDSFSDEYPGFLSALAIFPNDVFAKGKPILEETIQTFVEKGVKAKELDEHKEEIVGNFKVGLSTTVGMCSMLFGVVLSGKTVSYIDEYTGYVTALPLREVNRVIKKHIDFSLAKTAASGAIQKEGAPL